MPLDVGNPKLVTIPLPAEGEWVRVTTTMSRADRKEIGFRTAARAQILGLPLDNANPLLQTEAAFITLAVAIRAWSFDAPITTDSVRSLDEDSMGVIFEKLAELLPSARTDDDLKNSSGSGAAPSSDEAQSLPSSAG